MIPARRSALFTSFFAWHARRRFASQFEAVRVGGLDEARAAARRGPLLIVSNHTSWWDPLLALHLSHALGLETYAMMDAANLRRLPFFAWIGAFGVDLGDPRDGVRAMRYAATLLDRPGRAVWIFPQGEERPITERPVVFRAGSAEIARRAPGARVLPVGLRYELGRAERPFALVSIGPAFTCDGTRAERVAAQERAVDAELERIDVALRMDAMGELETSVRGAGRPVAALAEAVLARVASIGSR